MPDKEKKIEDFLSENPEFIDARFKGVKSERQTTIVAGRTDLIFRKRRWLTIVEIKRGILTLKDAEQLNRYIRSFKERGEALSKNHYLIGQKPVQPEPLMQKAKECGIRLRFFYSDIPAKFLYDHADRVYVPYDETLAEQSCRYDHYYEFRF